MLTKLKERQKKDGTISEESLCKQSRDMSKSIFSFSVDKCSKYWPDTAGQIIQFGSIVVQNIKEEIVSALDGLIVRKFKAIN
jgi:hypothetical protein